MDNILFLSSDPLTHKCVHLKKSNINSMGMSISEIVKRLFLQKSGICLHVNNENYSVIFTWFHILKWQMPLSHKMSFHDEYNNAAS